MFEAADVMQLEPTGLQHSGKRLLLQQDRVRIQAFRPDGVRGDTLFGSAYSGLPGKCSVLPIKPDQLALDLDPVGRQDADPSIRAERVIEFGGSIGDVPIEI